MVLARTRGNVHDARMHKSVSFPFYHSLATSGLRSSSLMFLGILLIQGHVNVHVIIHAVQQRNNII